MVGRGLIVESADDPDPSDASSRVPHCSQKRAFAPTTAPQARQRTSAPPHELADGLGDRR
jgi:hypothetical protein